MRHSISDRADDPWAVQVDGGPRETSPTPTEVRGALAEYFAERPEDKAAEVPAAVIERAVPKPARTASALAVGVVLGFVLGRISERRRRRAG